MAMEKLNLLEHETDAVSAIEDDWGGGIQKTLLVMPEGTGEDEISAQIIMDEEENGHRVLILGNRTDMVEYVAGRVEELTGEECAIEMGDQHSAGTSNAVTVASVQSLKGRLSDFSRDEFDTIIVREAHHALSDSYQSILKYFGDAKVLGITPTPDRGDKRNLGEYFQKASYEYSLQQAIKEKMLSPVMAHCIPIQIDVSQVERRDGDISADEAGDVLKPYLSKIADEMVQGLEGRQTVVYLPTVELSREFSQMLESRGVSSIDVNGNDKNRDRKIEEFREGKHQVVCNAILLEEGLNCPGVECIVNLRPTESRPLYSHIIAQGMKPSPETGKEDLLIMDFTWMTGKHNLCRPACIISPDEEITAEMTKTMEHEKGKYSISEMNVRDAADKVIKRHGVHNMEEVQRKRLVASLEDAKDKVGTLVSPIAYAKMAKFYEVINYKTLFKEDRAPASKEDLETLKKYGIRPTPNLLSGKAKLIIKLAEERETQGMSSAQQMQDLAYMGFQDVDKWSYAAASEIFEMIRDNGMQVPEHINPFTYQPEKNEKEANKEMIFYSAINPGDDIAETCKKMEMAFNCIKCEITKEEIDDLIGEIEDIDFSGMDRESSERFAKCSNQRLSDSRIVNEYALKSKDFSIIRLAQNYTTKNAEELLSMMKEKGMDFKEFKGLDMLYKSVTAKTKTAIIDAICTDDSMSIETKAKKLAGTIDKPKRKELRQIYNRISDGTRYDKTAIQAMDNAFPKSCMASLKDYIMEQNQRETSVINDSLSAIESEIKALAEKIADPEQYPQNGGYPRKLSDDIDKLTDKMRTVALEIESKTKTEGFGNTDGICKSLRIQARDISNLKSEIRLVSKALKISRASKNNLDAYQQLKRMPKDIVSAMKEVQDFRKGCEDRRFGDFNRVMPMFEEERSFGQTQ